MTILISRISESIHYSLLNLLHIVSICHNLKQWLANNNNNSCCDLIKSREVLVLKLTKLRLFLR